MNKQNNIKLNNFKPIKLDELYKYEGGFAFLPWIMTGMLGFITYKLFNATNGSIRINGIGDAKWDEPKPDNSKKEIRVIYYPY